MGLSRQAMDSPERMVERAVINIYVMQRIACFFAKTIYNVIVSTKSLMKQPIFC